MALLLFVPAGTLSWPAAWVFLAEMTSLGLFCGFLLNRRDPALLRERLRPLVQKDQTVADKILLSSIVVLFIPWLVLMALDAVRFG